MDDVLREAEDAGITKDVDMNEDETMEGTEGAAPTVEAEAEAQHEPQVYIDLRCFFHMSG